MQPYDRYSSFTRAYQYLLGLRSLPIGLLFLVAGIQQLGTRWLVEGDCTITVPLLLAAFAAWFLIGRYYDRVFGHVEPAELNPREKLVTYIFPVILIIAIILENILFRMGIPLPISFIELTIGVAWIFAGRASARWYYILVGALAVVFSFIPLITGSTVGNKMFGSFGILFNFYLGIAIIVTALLDHFRLVSGFHPLNGDDHAGAA